MLRIIGDDVVVGGPEALMAQRLVARDVHWLGRDVATEPFEAAVRIRHRHPPAPARVVPTSTGFEAHFLTPQRAITPGQAAVVYRGDEVLGGGFIQ